MSALWKSFTARTGSGVAIAAGLLLGPIVVLALGGLILGMAGMLLGALWPVLMPALVLLGLWKAWDLYQRYSA
jgi:hypothetical protein